MFPASNGGDTVEAMISSASDATGICLYEMDERREATK